MVKQLQAGLLTYSPFTGLPITLERTVAKVGKGLQSLQQRVLLPIYTAFPLRSKISETYECKSNKIGD